MTPASFHAWDHGFPGLGWSPPWPSTAMPWALSSPLLARNREGVRRRKKFDDIAEGGNHRCNSEAGRLRDAGWPGRCQSFGGRKIRRTVGNAGVRPGGVVSIATAFQVDQCAVGWRFEGLLPGREPRRNGPARRSRDITSTERSQRRSQKFAQHGPPRIAPH
jgi:hypothetical protein